MKKNILVVIFISNLFLNSSAQNQDVQLYAYNTLFGGITAGVGSIINKNKNENSWKVFKRSFLYGSVGGSVSYLGKKFAYNINGTDNYHYGWISKLVHSYGVSIIENAALNKQKVFSSVRMPIGFVMLDISFEEKFKLHPKIMPISLTSFIIHSTKYKLKVAESLQVGTPVFDMGLIFGKANYSIYNNIALLDIPRFEGYILAHEFIHTLQFREFMVFNTFLKKPYKSLTKNLFAKNLDKYLFFDLNYMFLTDPIIKRYPFGPDYYKNWFEFEAERFSTNAQVNR